MLKIPVPSNLAPEHNVRFETFVLFGEKMKKSV